MEVAQVPINRVHKKKLWYMYKGILLGHENEQKLTTTYRKGVSVASEGAACGKALRRLQQGKVLRTS